MSLFRKRERDREPLLRVVFEVDDHGDGVTNDGDDRPSLVSVERVDGLLSIHGFEPLRPPGVWWRCPDDAHVPDPDDRVDVTLLRIERACCAGFDVNACDPSVEWFNRDWDNAGSHMIEGELGDLVFADLERVVVEGRMWSSHYNGPDGEDWDGGFRVERVVERTPRVFAPRAS